MHTILIDIDNTLIETLSGQTTVKSRLLLHELSKMDVKLVGFTSRPGFLKWFTKWQLKRAGVKLHNLIMNKPRGCAYIGNRAVSFDCRHGDPREAVDEIKELVS